MDWENEPWIKLYTRDLPEFLSLPWEARFVWYELHRKVDRAGILQLGRAGRAVLPIYLHLPEQVLDAGLDALVAAGLVTEQPNLLVISDFIDSQKSRKSGKQRAREYRERRRAAALTGKPLRAIDVSSPIEFESPIENAFFTALISQATTDLYVRAFTQRVELVAGKMISLGGEGTVYDFGQHAGPRPQLEIFIQVSVEQFIVDFVIFFISEAGGVRSEPLVVECDGHEFHERTKEQAQKDRSRDRTLQSVGLTIFRFTGVELFANPATCAVECLTHLRESLGRLRSTGVLQ